MRVAEHYSHLNGLEYILVHKPNIWQEIKDVIRSVDPYMMKSKVSEEKNRKGKMLYSPKEMNRAIKYGFKNRGWKESRTSYWVTKDEKLIRKTFNMSEYCQKQEIEAARQEAIRSYNQTDFVKDRVAVEVQLGNILL